MGIASTVSPSGTDPDSNHSHTSIQPKLLQDETPSVNQATIQHHNTRSCFLDLLFQESDLETEL